MSPVADAAIEPLGPMVLPATWKPDSRERRVRRGIVSCLVLVCTVAGCGSRSGLDDFDAEAGAVDGGDRDAASHDAASHDATRADASAPDAFRPPDAGPACPARSDFGYRLLGLGPLGLGFEVDELSLGGDGRSVYLAVLAAWEPGVGYRSVLYRLEPAEPRANELATIDGGRNPRVSVTDGVARMIALDSAGWDLTLLEARDGVASELGRSEIFHGSRMVMDRPAWNGTDVIVAGTTGDLFIGPFALGAATPDWSGGRIGDDLAGIAAQPETGTTEVVYRAADLNYRAQTYDPGGGPLGPDGGIALTDRFERGVAFGWLDGDGGAQPFVLAGFTVVDGTLRAAVQRFRTDGTPAGGFSTPVDGMPGAVDLSTVAVPPHSHGYGMAAAAHGGPAIFHGAGQDFVGDASTLPLSCDATGISVAAGPCGYIVACLAGGEIELALAIPPDPR